MPDQHAMLANNTGGRHWQGVDANIDPNRFVEAMLAACAGHGPDADT